MLIYAFITGIVALLAAVLLLGFGLRGRRINDHVVCAKCRFDLEGVYPGAEASAVESGGAGWRGRCPECGRELVGARCVKRGVRERSRGMLVGAGVCAAVFVGAGALVANQARQQGFNVYQHKPVWLLALEGEGPWPTVANAALSELVDRQMNGELGGEREAAVIQRALAYQGDTERVWRTGWGSLIENAIVGNRLSETDIERYARQAVVIDIVARKTVRLGEFMPANLRVEERTAASSLLAYGIFNEGAKFGGDDLGGAIDHLIRKGGYGSIHQYVSGINLEETALRDLQSKWVPPNYTASGDLGARELSTRWVVVVGRHTAGAVHSGGGFGPWTTQYRASNQQAEWSADPNWRSVPVHDEVDRLLVSDGGNTLVSQGIFQEVGDALAKWRVECNTTVDIVAADAETVRLVDDGAILVEAESWLRSLGPVEVSQGFNSGLELQFISLFHESPPIPMVFDVLVRDGEIDHRLGTLIADIERERRVVYAPGQFVTFGSGSPVWMTRSLPSGFQARTVDLIFRPNPDAARRTIGIDRIVGREFVFEQVPVQWPAGGPAGQVSP